MNEGERIPERLRRQFGDGTTIYTNWLEPLQFLAVVGGRLRLAAPNAEVRDYVQDRYAQGILSTAVDLGLGIASVELEVDEQPVPDPPLVQHRSTMRSVAIELTLGARHPIGKHPRSPNAPALEVPPPEPPHGAQPVISGPGARAWAASKEQSRDERDGRVAERTVAQSPGPRWRRSLRLSPTDRPGPIPVPAQGAVQVPGTRGGRSNRGSVNTWHRPRL